MRGNAARAVLPALGVLALVGVVAIAATGSIPSGSNTGRTPADSVMDTILTLVLLLFIPAAAIYIYGLTQRKAIANQIRTRPFRRLDLLGVVVFTLFVTVFVYFRRGRNRLEPVDEFGEPIFPDAPPTTPTGGKPTKAYDAEFAWLPVFVVIGLAVLAAVALFISSRRANAARRKAETIAEALASALDESLDDLRAETDARRAVIAAYARLERVLAAHGHPRRDSETPDELLGRILPGLDVDRRSISRLTHLYTWAKFSHHDVDTNMKEEAIGALEQVRDELRAAAEAEQERLQTPPAVRAGEGRA